jgi:hypothetical protein
MSVHRHFVVRVCSDFPPGRGARFFRQHQPTRSGLAAKRRLSQSANTGQQVTTTFLFSKMDAGLMVKAQCPYKQSLILLFLYSQKDSILFHIIVLLY